MVLKHLGTPLSLNADAANLEFTHLGQWFQQKLTCETEAENVYLLPVHKRIVLANNEILFRNAEIYNDMAAPPAYSDGLYLELLYKTRDELIDNARALLSHPRFDHVVCDITGGLDSRIALAALTNVPDPDHKLALSSIDGNYVPENDLKTAIAVSKAVNLPFDTAPTTVMNLNSLEYFTNAYSLFLGTYYLFENLVYGDVKNDKYVRATGRYVECGRAYMRHNYAEMTYSDDDELIASIVKYKGNGSVLVTPNGKLLSESYLEKEIQETTGVDVENKLENLFINTRLAIHFANRTYSRYMCFNFNVGVSKCAFKLRQMCWQRKDMWLHPQFDTLTLLNPLLAALEYGNEYYNKYMTAHSATLRSPKIPLIHIEVDRKDYDSAMALRKQRVTRKGAADAPPVTERQVYDFVHRAICHMANYRLDDYYPLRDAAFGAWSYYKTHYGTEKAVPMYFKVLKSKILSLYYILRLLDEGTKE
jgi:hypothetical protein